MPALALVISNDWALSDAVHKGTSDVQDVELVRRPCLPAAEDLLADETLGVVFVHIDSRESMQACQHLLQASKKLPYGVVAICEKYSALLAAELLSGGAIECMGRPVDIRRISLLTEILAHRLRHRCPQSAVPTPRPGSAITRCAENFLVDTASMGESMSQIRAVSPLDTTVLLTGETGTGKTHMAKLIHQQSGRHSRPFVVVNCGALSDSLVESELFGHVRGAFTGADRDHQGKFSAASDGTLVLDEIDSLPVATQGKLLRVIEERVFERVGCTKTQTLDARLIVATNRNLEEEVNRGQFRADLFHRINVVAFELPPLRERQGLIEPLIEHFVGEYAVRHGRHGLSIDEDAMRILKAYFWPGNIREVRNTLERAVAICNSRTIGREHLPRKILDTATESPKITRSPSVGKWFRTKFEAEVNALVGALNKHNNNRLQAAKELGISRVTLYKKLRKYGIA